MDLLFEIAVFASHLAAAPHGIDAAQVCVLGNAPELGAWDSTQAVPLHLVEGSPAKTKFVATVHFPPEREFFALEYKYIIKDTKTGDVVSWEAIPGNRTLTLTHSTNAALAKPAKQSSTYTTDSAPSPGPRAASLGNNGNHNGFHEWWCARTTREANPWWSVDLKAPQTLSRLNLWKAMTYHEQPKRAAAKPPASSVATMRSSSALPAPPVWVVVSNQDLSVKSGEDLVRLVLADGYLPAGTRAFRLELHEDVRVETLDLEGVEARYVRIQYESTLAAVHFADVEVFANDTKSPADTQPLKRADGFFGVDVASDNDLDECIDGEWVDPLGENSLVRLWIGSFRKDVPAIQWFDGSSNSRPIHVAVRHQTHQRQENTDGVVEPCAVQEFHVDSRGASLLDKDGNEFRESLTALLHDPRHDLKPYLNSTEATSFDAWLERFMHTQLLDDVHIAQLRAQSKIQTFEGGASLLQYGERTRTAFFILHGLVEVTGPQTVTGSIALGSISAGCSVNDLALFSSWPERSAEFKAKGKVTVQTITYATLKLVLGEAKLRTLRHQLLRERQALDSTPALESPGKLLVVDADRAQVFRTRVPTASLTATDTLSIHRLTIEFYESAEVGTTIASNKDKGRLIGSAPLLPTQLDKHGEGFLTLPILSTCEPITVVGQVALHYLVIRPFVHPKNNLSNVWRSYWRERSPLRGGHRGMGRSFNQVGNFRKALTRENTLASLILAGRSGAEFVEFDVQLTKDHVPVLYHDFIFRVGLEDKQAWSHAARAEQHEIAIYQLTLRELTRSHTSVVPKKDPPMLQRLIKKHWHTLLGRVATAHGTARTLPDPARGTVGVVEPSDNHLVDFYPRLEDLLKHVPPEIELNIEIKYPDPLTRSAYRSTSSFAMNYYIDTILQCVFDHAGVGRRIFFSCFDPDLVVALRAKQATYPVSFLTFGRVQPTFDARLSLQFAHNFAKMEKLRGVVSNSDEFLVEPACVELIKRDGLVLVTWGDQNTSHACVHQQQRRGVDGIISDNIGDLMRNDRDFTK